jgi:phosphate transport system substrate-binding protein
LIYETGAQAYPIVNFEYLIINPSKITTSDTALAIRTFIEWAISPTGGATADNLSAVGFVPLPTTVIPLVNTAVAQITG